MGSLHTHKAQHLRSDLAADHPKPPGLNISRAVEPAMTLVAEQRPSKHQPRPVEWGQAVRSSHASSWANPWNAEI
ncbi:hypothetical protein J1614_009244 [Plenodomus biglobosus]|nr:hypothetical protein J1614_009244 [Plenodomus biglobosus]